MDKAKIETIIKENNWQNWIQLIQSSVNGGFSSGNNIGIKSGEFDYYLLLNSDAYVHKDAIKNMLRTMSIDKSIGIVGPRLEWENGGQQVSCFNNMTPFGEFVRTANTGIITKLFKLMNIKESARSMASEVLDPDWVSLACVMLRKEMINTAMTHVEQYNNSNMINKHLDMYTELLNKNR